MAVPAFWNTSFTYTEVPGITDITQMIAAVNTALTAPALGWTDESGVGTGPWRTPARPDGVFFRLSMTRASQTRANLAMYDQCGLNVMAAYAYTIDIDAGGTTLHIYGGTTHFAITSARTTHETFYAFIHDQTPEPINFPNAMYGCACGPRGSTGTLLNYSWNFHMQKEPNSTSYSQRQSAIMRMPSTGGTMNRRTVGLTSLFAPVEFGDSVATPPMFYGRIPQAIVIDNSTGISPGAEVTVPIDAGINATFKLVGQASAGWCQQLLAFRKS